MAETKIKKSQNFLQVSGVLLETNLEVVENVKFEITNFKGDGSKKEVMGSVIKKKDVKNPAFLIETSPRDKDGNIIGTYQLGVDLKFNWDKGLKAFIIASKEFNKDGKIVDSGNFKGIETAINEYVTRKDAKEGEEATKVFIKSGFLSPNEYVSKEGEFKTYLPTITTYNITSSGVPEHDICEGKLTGRVKSVIPEVVNEEETGRVKVEFYFFDSKGEVYPLTFVGEEDVAEALTDDYPTGTNATFYYEILTKQVGAKKAKVQGGLGRNRQPETVSGYTMTEYSLFNAEEMAEENELYVETKELKKALESRNITIEQRIKDAKDKEKSGGASRPSGAKSGGLGSRASKVDEGFMNIPDGIDEELPFN